MGTPTPPAKVKLIVGFIFSDNSSYLRAKELLMKRFGAVDFESDTLAFTHTTYYDKEFGSGLLRKFLSFKKLINPGSLASIKNTANRIEAKLSRASRRTVNIDPGYMELAKLVLASTKNFFHRVYIGRGIYAEVTLYYRNKGFMSLEWTYPDYKERASQVIFASMRELLAAQIKK